MVRTTAALSSAPAPEPDVLAELDLLVRLSTEDPDAVPAACLELGTRLLGMSTGIVSHIADGSYVVEAVRSPLAIAAGDTYELCNTYCAEVARSGEMVALPSVGDDEAMAAHPVYVAMRLEGYISAPIEVRGELVGTLNFTDLDPHEGGFEEWELQLVRMMAFVLGRKAERESDAARHAASNKTLLHSQDRFVKAIDRSPIGVLLMDLDGSVRRANAATAELLGTTVEALIGSSVEAWLHPDDREAEVERMRRLVAGAEADGRFQARMLTSDGAVLDVEIHGAVTLDESGEPDGIIGHLVDVSAQARLMRRLRRSQERFRQSFDHAGIAMATTRIDGQLTRVNDAFCELLGYTQREMLAMRFADFTHPEDRGRSVDLVDDALQTGRQQYQFEKRYIHKNGRIVRVALNVAVVRDEDGSPLALIGQAVDVTAERSAQEQLAASELRFRLMAEQSVDLVARHSEEGIFEYVSPAVGHLLGLRAEDLVGESLYGVVHADDLAIVAAAHTAARGSEGQATFEARMRCADGAYRWMETTLVQVRVGDVLELHSSSRDIGHRKDAEAALAQRAQELESANVALAAEAGTDALTGLANRRRYSEALEAAVSSAKDSDGPVSLILLDVDHFKSYNDTFGHPAGDVVLSTLGRLLREQSRAGCIPARHGGEEFAVVLPGTTRVEARALAERLRLSIATHHWPERSVTASFGLAEIRPAALGLEAAAAADALVQHADQALYEAKRGGRNRVVYRSTGF